MNHKKHIPKHIPNLLWKTMNGKQMINQPSIPLTKRYQTQYTTYVGIRKRVIPFPHTFLNQLITRRYLSFYSTQYALCLITTITHLTTCYITIVILEDDHEHLIVQLIVLSLLSRPVSIVFQIANSELNSNASCFI